jgi:hypothetical protein
MLEAATRAMREIATDKEKVVKVIDKGGNR